MPRFAAARAARAHECQNASPGVFAFLAMLLERTIEERMGRVWVCLDVMVHAGIVQRGHERRDVALRDSRIGAPEESEDRCAHALRLFGRERPRLSFTLAESPVEADDAGDPGYLG